MVQDKSQLTTAPVVFVFHSVFVFGKDFGKLHRGLNLVMPTLLCDVNVSLSTHSVTILSDLPHRYM